MKFYVHRDPNNKLQMIPYAGGGTGIPFRPASISKRGSQFS